jgi:hypothetical protein
MDKRKIAVETVLVLLGLGGAAMMQVAPVLFPGHEELIFWLGVTAVVVAVIGACPIALHSAQEGRTATSA